MDLHNLEEGQIPQPADMDGMDLVIAQQQQQILNLQQQLEGAQAAAAQAQPVVQPPVFMPPKVQPQQVPRALHKPQMLKAFTRSEKSPGYVFTWFFQMELYFTAAHVPVREWAVVAATNLDGTAALWLQQQAHQLDWSVITWDIFKQALMQSIIPADLANRNVDQLLDCKQGDRSVDDFALQFRCLAFACPSMSDHVQAVHFMRGLAHHLQHDMFRANPQNLNAAVLAARQAEVAARRGRPQGDTHSNTMKKPDKGKQRQMTAGPQKRPNSTTQGKFQGNCYNCGKPGHKAVDCRLPKKGSQNNANASTNNFKAQFKSMQAKLAVLTEALVPKPAPNQSGN